MNADFRQRAIKTVSATALLALTLLLFGPLQLYYTNVLNFPYFFADTWYFFVILTSICILVLSSGALLLKEAVHKKVISLIFVLAFLFWLQGNVILVNYGLLDGKEINWGDYKLYGILNTLIWLSLLVIGYIKSEMIYKLISKGSVALIIVQTISILITGYQAPEQPEWKRYTVEEEDKYTFSKKKNVIILVLDTFQTDIFQELINDNKKYSDQFKDFTYFRNSLGGFPSTFLSIPLILTGRYYDNSVPISQYQKEAFLSSSIPYILKKNGYQTELYVDRRLFYCDQYVASNIKKSKDLNEVGNDLMYTYRVTLFRYMPHYLKKYFNDVFTEASNGDLRFADKVVSEINADSDKYVFKFFHLWAIHPPFHLNEQLELEEQEFSREGYKEQAKATLEITDRFLTGLKKIGAYDNSLIFIVGDHGASASGFFGLNVKASEHSEYSKSVNRVKTKRTVASGLPLILIKPFGSNRNMEISDAPVSLSDIPKTAISELGLTANLPGENMFKVKQSEFRERRFLEYIWKNEYVNDQYMSDMDEYVVSGFSWLKQSWRPTYKKYTSKGVVDTSPHPYKLDSRITFGKAGNAEQYQGMGWSGPDNGFTWTDGKNVSLIIPIKKPVSNLMLKAKISPYIAGAVQKQKVRIYVGGKVLGEWDVVSGGEYNLLISENFIKNGWLELYFELPDAISPAELRISDEPRKLGIAVNSITISEMPEYQYGSPIIFGMKGNYLQYPTKGWSNPENKATWTNGGSASLLIPFKQLNSDIVLKVNLLPFVTERHAIQKVEVYINNNPIGQWKVTAGGDYTITVPKKYFNGSVAELNFKLPDAISPAKLGVSADTRNLGIMVNSITLTEK